MSISLLIEIPEIDSFAHSGTEQGRIPVRNRDEKGKSVGHKKTKQHQGRHPKSLAIAIFCGAVGALSLASVALAAPHRPTGESAQFSDCPLDRATITDCIFSVYSGGSFTIGKKTVPIKNPITLQGGAEGSGSEVKFFGAEDGNTLSKTPQPVPGGLLGIKAPAWWPKFIQERFNGGINHGLNGVNATIELAAPASTIKLNNESLFNGEGIALGLPVKIKLSNPLLGPNCYIGSNSKPIEIDFTTGTTAPPPPNKPIEGSSGELSFDESFSIITFSGERLVNNTFAAPAASGCGGFFSIFVDPLVNAIFGTPAASGRNTAILEGIFQDAASSTVRESEK